MGGAVDAPWTHGLRKCENAVSRNGRDAMSLYGLHGEENIRKMFEHMAALQKLYIESEAPAFLAIT